MPAVIHHGLVKATAENIARHREVEERVIIGRRGISFAEQLAQAPHGYRGYAGRTSGAQAAGSFVGGREGRSYMSGTAGE